MKKPEDINVLLACEESQAVCIEFRKLGFNAFSSDTQECSGGHPEWHIKGDVLEVLNGQLFTTDSDESVFTTQDGQIHFIDRWDLMIGFPPCKYITFAGNGWFDVGKWGEKALTRWEKRIEGVRFFNKLWTADVPHIALENPMGFMEKVGIKHTQVIHPYYFGCPHMKRTCLFLKNLPPLTWTKEKNLFEQDVSAVPPPEPIYKEKSGKNRYITEAMSPSEERTKLRSKTFAGIAAAMAKQWGTFILETRSAKS